MSEKHEKSFEEFDLRVEVTDDGHVWLSFHSGGKTVLTMAWDELREVADFTAVHGLRMEAPYIVAMKDAEAAGLT